MTSRRLSRRQFLGLTGTLGAAALLASALPRRAAASALADAGAKTALSPLGFTEIAKRLSDEPAVAPGYRIQPLLSWGDPLFDQAAAFDPRKQSPEDQARRFGYNNDFIAYMPLPRGSENGEHGLLCVNHEYTNLRLMFPGIEQGSEPYAATETQGRIEQEAQGASVVEIKRTEQGWQALEASRYNRRLTATTPILLHGPAAGDVRMRTSADPEGQTVLGTFANCAGGVTPWGTVLTAEENFDQYFANMPNKHPDFEHWRRYGVGSRPFYNWHRFDPRFDLATEPNEPNRFGWIVEYDPYDPAKPPIKRTALGRFKHECATCAVAPDGRVAAYSGDDQTFEYIYRFLTARAYDPDDRAANEHLLDEGTLSVARFLPDGTLEWLPLVHGSGPLTAENGFASQADVVIEARRAADLLGATPMDRPEDVELQPRTGRLYVSLTKNHERGNDRRNPANRRAPNPFGHVIEMIPPEHDGRADHAADQFRWEIFLEGGDPRDGAHQAFYAHAPSEHGWLTNPDNLACDPAGHLWIATDGQEEAIRMNDGLYAVPTEGPQRGAPRLFFTAPLGAEVTGPRFTPDGRTLFLSVQHPGELPEDSSYEQPSTRWPDRQEGRPPRPTVIAITKEDGGVIGS